MTIGGPAICDVRVTTPIHQEQSFRVEWPAIGSAMHLAGIHRFLTLLSYSEHHYESFA
jgi:hypothetical protein